MPQTHPAVESRLRPATVPDLLYEAAQRFDSATALVAPDREATTYAALHQFVRHTRAALFTSGVRPGQRIAVAMPAGPEALTAVLAAMSAGIALPLNPELPSAAITRRLRAFQADAVIAAGSLSAFEEAASELNLPFLALQLDDALPAGCFHLPLPRTASGAQTPPFLPFSTATVLESVTPSGETRRAPLTHANLLVNAAAIEELLALTPSDRFFHTAPQFRGIGIALTLAALRAGNVILAAPGFDRAAEFEPTWFWASPAVLTRLLHWVGVRGGRPCGLNLRAIATGPRGWNTSAAAVEDAFGVPLLEIYGVPEAAIHVAPPAAGSEVLILGDDGSPAPAGVEGEILTRGSGVISAYEDGSTGGDFWTGDGSRWFRTGDRGRLDAAGLVVNAREVDIIHSAGGDVWPHEVEEVLREHPAVEQAAVFRSGEEVCAAVVLHIGEEVDEIELRQFASAHLAPHETPTRIAFVPAFHQSGGTLQRNRLAAALGMTPRIPPASTNLAPPATPLERELMAIWSEILEVPRVGLDDDFFLLGGGPQEVAKLLAVLQQRYGVMRRKVDRVQFFDHPTLRAQAFLIEQANRERAAAGEREPSAAPEQLPAILIALNEPIRRKHEAPPLFLAPETSASPEYMRAFAHSLAGDQRCFALNCEGAAAETVALAEAFADAIVAARPEGPLYLGGHGTGGVVAYEAARQLAAVGRAPETLYLFDAPLVGEPRPFAGPAVLFLARGERNAASEKDRRLGWLRCIAPPPELVHVDGPAGELFGKANAAEMAAVCRQRLPRPSLESMIALATSVEEAEPQAAPKAPSTDAPSTRVRMSA